MKRKYYMRGLGFGILITTLVFSFLPAQKPADEEIIKRAEELGYVLPEPSNTPGLNLDELKGKETPIPTMPLTNTPQPKPQPQSSPAPTETVELTETPIPTVTVTVVPTEVPKITLTVIPTQTIAPTPTDEPVAEPTKEAVPTESVVRAQVTVVKGNTASKVCRMIEEAGIVKDWEELRDYLKSRDLVNEINVGTFNLSSDMTLEQIAKIITGK